MNQYHKQQEQKVLKDIKIKQDSKIQSFDKENILQILSRQNKIQYVYTNDIIGQPKHLFYTVFMQKKTEFTPLALLDTGEIAEVKHTKTFSYFKFNNQRYIFKIGAKLKYQGGIVNTLNNNGIKHILEHKAIEKFALYTEIMILLDEYYDFFCNEELYLIIIHIIHTYLLNILGKTFYILLEGDKGTGKSSLQILMSKLQFNGSFSGKTSMPALIRKIHFYQATVNIDEFDKLSKEDKSIAAGILNTGFYKNGTYEIVNMNSKKLDSQLQIFNTFSSKTFSANRAYFDESFLSRCAIIRTLKNKKRVKNIFNASDDQFQIIRNNLFNYCLFNWRDIVKDIGEVKTNLEQQQLYGRNTDIMAIQLGIQKHFCDDNADLKNYLFDKINLDSDDNVENSIFYNILKYLANMQFKNDNKYINFTNSELCAHLNGALHQNDGCQITSSRLGKFLKRYRIIEKLNEKQRITTDDKEETKGSVSYIITTDKFKNIVGRTDFDDLKKIACP